MHGCYMQQLLFYFLPFLSVLETGLFVFSAIKLNLKPKITGLQNPVCTKIIQYPTANLTVYVYKLDKWKGGILCTPYQCLQVTVPVHSLDCLVVRQISYMTALYPQAHGSYSAIDDKKEI